MIKSRTNFTYEENAMKKLLLISIFSLTICLTACGNNAVVEETTTVETTESVAETLEETKEP